MSDNLYEYYNRSMSISTTQESLTTHVGPLQRSRWVFTINNYDRNINVRSQLSNDVFKVKRAVWGYEIGEEGTRHIQGYLEIVRSVRLCFVKRIFPNAHWDAARKGALENYEYCTKGGLFDCIGDFSDVFKKTRGNLCKPASVPLILRGLMDPMKKPQIVASKEYAERFLYFEKTRKDFAELKNSIDIFNRWKSYRLFPWQERLLKIIVAQSDREVLWVIDYVGNSGKSFLANVLNILYGFTLLNETLSIHDIGPMLSEVRGFVLDIPRAKIQSFDYGFLECAKNGYMASGKYTGVFKRFKPSPVVVFANDAPNRTALSEDRWRIVHLGHGDFQNMRCDLKIPYPHEIPFISPPKFPVLNEDFNLREYLANEANIQGHEISSTNENNQNGVVYRASTSAGNDVQDLPLIQSQTSTIGEGTSERPTLILPQNPPVCTRHPDQSLFRKGCPCLGKKKNLSKRLRERIGGRTIFSQTLRLSGSSRGRDGRGPAAR